MPESAREFEHVRLDADTLLIRSAKANARFEQLGPDVFAFTISGTRPPDDVAAFAPVYEAYRKALAGDPKRQLTLCIDAGNLTSASMGMADDFTKNLRPMLPRLRGFVLIRSRMLEMVANVALGTVMRSERFKFFSSVADFEHACSTVSPGFRRRVVE